MFVLAGCSIESHLGELSCQIFSATETRPSGAECGLFDFNKCASIRGFNIHNEQALFNAQTLLKTSMPQNC
jgi:hypothetical protein